MKFTELMTRASKGELTVDHINEIVLAIGEENARRDKWEKDLNNKVAKHDRGLRDINEEYPLLPPEADDLSKAVKRKGVEVMGGKKSNAYNDKELRAKIYRDIYGEVKREYGLINDRGGQMSYKKLKRKYLPGAFTVVDEYILPMALQEEVDSINDIDMDE